jgi:hypothetical protein
MLRQAQHEVVSIMIFLSPNVPMLLVPRMMNFLMLSLSKRAEIHAAAP